jgi:hypothetical protein
MENQQLIDQLVSTYSVLNHDVRSRPEDLLQQGVPSARQVIKQLRDGELRFSQDLKARVSGQPVSYEETQELATLGTETDHDSTASLIAQFGTARESTLAMLHDLPLDQWDAASDNARTIRTDVSELIERDRRALGSITNAIGVSTG